MELEKSVPYLSIMNVLSICGKAAQTLFRPHHIASPGSSYICSPGANRQLRMEFSAFPLSHKSDSESFIKAHTKSIRLLIRLLYIQAGQEEAEMMEL